ncbi:MAG: ComEA family DNA-binding protein [Candidatus Methylacidiphilales bacterium]
MKKTKLRLEKFIKMYFYFSPSEKKGILLLVAVLVVVMLLPTIYRTFKPSNNLTISLSQMAELDAISSQTSLVKYSDSEPFAFNPNTATAQELKQLGFTDKNIATLQNYLSKGGKIKSVEGLKKIYGIKVALVDELAPYIQFEKTELANYKKAFADSTKNTKSKQFAPLELNSADSIQLVKLYRIGPALAHKILDYRTKLGGFLNLNQLTEIWGFDEDILFDLQGKIYVDANKAKRINLNTVTEEELKMHPYFKFKVARVIVNYRNQHGKFRNFSDLLQIKIINDSILNNIKIYGVIE